MNTAQKAMDRSAVEAAARLPLLAEGESILDPKWTVRPRIDGRWRAYKDGAYWGTTGCKEEVDARRWLDVMIKQQQAALDGVYDVRRVPVAQVIADRQKAVVRNRYKGAKVIVSTLKAFGVYVEGLELRQLTDERIERVGLKMVADGFSHEYFVNGARFLATAIKIHTRKSHGAAYLPFDPPPRPKGRQTVVSDAERDRVKRWRACTEDYDPKTGAWSPAGVLSATERRDRELTYRELYLGITFGSRPGAYGGLSWEPNDEGGWIDLDRAIFHRIPPGARTPSNKLAPSVQIDPGVLPELRRWKEMDGGRPWVFPTLKGTALSQGQQAKIFKAGMEKLGIGKVTGHVLRHTCITASLSAGAPPQSVAAMCGVSVKFLLERYAHLCQFAVQKLAHGIVAKLMG